MRSSICCQSWGHRAMRVSFERHGTSSISSSEIVDPKKDERILDPACGTAGVLISAYKHIGKTNEDVETPLTSAERTRLAENVRGI